MPFIRLKTLHLFRAFEVCGTLANTWPPNRKSSRVQLVVRDFIWLIGVINVIGLLLSLIYGAYHYRENTVVMMKSLCEMAAAIETLLDMILCRLNRYRFQVLLEEMKDFFINSNEDEKAILQKYVDRYSTFTVLIGWSFFMTAIFFCLGPLLLDMHFLADAWFPFSTESRGIRYIIYFHEVLGVFHTALCLNVDFTIAMLFWYSSARLEMLGLELQEAQDAGYVKACIQKHKDIMRSCQLKTKDAKKKASNELKNLLILRFIAETQNVARYLLFKTNIAMGFNIICGTFSLIHVQSFIIMFEFTFMVVSAYPRLYVTAQPADDLMEISAKITWYAYCSSWIGKPKEMSLMVLVIMQRSQIPLLISMGKVLPALSLKYYVNFVYTTSSYFLTMRAVIEG